MAELLSNEAAERLRKEIENKLVWGKAFWKPLHDRMDYWYNMYLLLDLVQQSKPLGFRRFISNDPRTATDAAQSILTRNRSHWRIDMPAGQVGKEERAKIGKIEQALDGIVDDMDEMFLLRGEMPFWKQTAFFALMRGWLWGKFHVTETAREMGRPSPLLAELWDGRMVFPTFDGIGLASVIAEKHTTLAELVMQYPEVVNLDPAEHDLNAPAIKLEYWSNTRLGRPGVMGVLGIWSAAQTAGAGVFQAPGETATAGNRSWLIPPREHGYTPEQLPVVGSPVNGIPIKSKPMAGRMVSNALEARASRLGANPPSWHDPAGWVAESGRGFLSAVEENLPQYNELIATALQHFSIGTFGQWVFWTASGESPEWEEGMNAKIPLHIGEEAKRFDPAPISSDAWQLLQVLKDERQRGMLASVLQASSAFQGSGVMLQQTIHSALNALEPFQSGMGTFGSQVGSHILEQLKAEDFGTLSLVVRSSRAYFNIEFDPKTDLGKRKYRPFPVFTPSLPEDMMMKAQVARILLDPRRPVASLVTVIDRVFQWEDPEGEESRIFADIANLDPVIVLERVAQALEEEGLPEVAERIRTEQFRAMFTKDLQFRQMAAAAGVEGALPGPGPETGAVTATGGLTGRSGQGQAAEQGGGMGATGERETP